MTRRATLATLAGGRVAVAGVGRAGAACVRALRRLDVAVVAVDEADGPGQRAAAAELAALGADVRLGSAELPDAELVVTSPGFPPTAPLLAAAGAAGLAVWGDAELAWRLRDEAAADWLVVTGTNGKTTTVGMLAAILTASGARAVAAGNVGTPLVEVVLADPAYDVLAVELSSFQLHYAPSITPAAAALLNLAPDHVDWHGSLAAYYAAKAAVLHRAGVPVGNADDPQVAARLPARARTFSLPGPADYRLAGDALVESASGEQLAEVDDVRPPGPHNVANALAAAALARAHGVPAAAVAAGLRAYTPGGHRNHLVTTVDGVGYVDDSKATNAHAAAASLAGYERVVWVAGGLLKGADVDELVAAHAHRLRGVVLLGRDRAVVAAALARHAPDVPVRECPGTETDVMRAVVAAARELARPGDTVLLAPAAASMDIFRDYAERGEAFAAAARELEPPA